jgi:hypothetical protein
MVNENHEREALLSLGGQGLVAVQAITRTLRSIFRHAGAEQTGFKAKNSGVPMSRK